MSSSTSTACSSRARTRPDPSGLAPAEAEQGAGEQLAVYPVAAVVGGFAVGALLAALLPRSEREEQLLGKTGRRLTGAAREAVQKGLDAGRDQLDEIRTRAAQKVGEAVTEAVTEAVSGKS